jgi:hypothetical protein
LTKYGRNIYLFIFYQNSIRACFGGPFAFLGLTITRQNPKTPRRWPQFIMIEYIPMDGWQLPRLERYTALLVGHGMGAARDIAEAVDRWPLHQIIGLDEGAAEVERLDHLFCFDPEKAHTRISYRHQRQKYGERGYVIHAPRLWDRSKFNHRLPIDVYWRGLKMDAGPVWASMQIARAMGYRRIALCGIQPIGHEHKLVFKEYAQTYPHGSVGMSGWIKEVLDE